MDTIVLAAMFHDLLPSLQLPSLTTILVLMVAFYDRSWTWIYSDTQLIPPSGFMLMFLVFLMLFTTVGISAVFCYWFYRATAAWVLQENSEVSENLPHGVRV